MESDPLSVDALYPLAGGGRSSGSTGARIAVVDDEPMICDMVSRALAGHGHEVQTFYQAEEFLEALPKDEFDLVFLDLRLPGLSGTTVLRLVKEHSPKIDVVIMTGFSSVESAITCMKEGAADYIPKPFSSDHILLVAQKTLYHREIARKAQERDFFEKLSKTDGLTGVFNHRFFLDLLQVEIVRSARYHHEFSLLMIDVDDFKLYNDRYGHPIGDQALQKIAAALRKTTRTSDYVARYGGEEFAVILTETAKDGACVCGERIRAAVNETELRDSEGRSLGTLSVSIGVASYPEDAAERDELIRKADAALYQAKARGKNQVAAAG